MLLGNVELHGRSSSLPPKRRPISSSLVYLVDNTHFTAL